MGLVAALDCLQQTNIAPEKVDAIEVGTAYGLHVDSAIFLTNMIERNETALNPTPFIQSTHNTISGAIALSLQCTGHNMTFVHKGFSFEHALLDAELLLNSAKEDSFLLVGGVDERIEVLNRFFKGKVRELSFGDASSFFLVSNSEKDALCKISASYQFQTKNTDVSAEKLEVIFAKHCTEANEVPIIIWNSLSAYCFVADPNIVDVSKTVGYNPTGSALALAIGVKHVQQQKKSVLVINQFDKYWSVFALDLV
jgi:3-oxoacyl-[acyl-carrier-protein] synthase III